MVEDVLPENIFPSRAYLSHVCALDRIPSGPKALGTFGDFPSWPPAAEEQEEGEGEEEGRWAVATGGSSQGLVYDREVEEQGNRVWVAHEEEEEVVVEEEEEGKWALGEY